VAERPASYPSCPLRGLRGHLRAPVCPQIRAVSFGPRRLQRITEAGPSSPSLFLRSWTLTPLAISAMLCLMSSLLDAVRDLVASGNVRISDHGYDELANDGIHAKDVVSGIDTAVVVQEYPDHGKGPCVLVLQRDRAELPVHAVWGIPRGRSEPAVLVTAYRPDAAIWEDDFLRRRR
jgi:hypothetical protein